MKEIIIYEAFDGTEFDDECECCEYERMKSGERLIGQIHFYDRHKKPLKISCDQEDVWYAAVDTVEAAEWWNDLCRYYSLRQPFEKRPYKPGFYWYNDHDEWQCLQEEMEKLQILAKEFQQFVE